MYKENKYVLKKETILLIPEYDEVGNLTTVLLEGEKVIRVSMRPTELIDYNLQYHGSSLRGASDCARLIFGEIRMSPVVINEQMGMYWFPVFSPSRAKCIWFALHHIKDYKCIGNNQTIVFLSNGSTITLDMRKDTFDKKVQRTLLFKHRMESRLSYSFMLRKESKEHYCIRKQQDGRNYTLEPME